MYLRRYPTRDYAIALAEEDLLAAIEEHGATYVLLTGEDAGFSSLSYAAYFADDPAYTLVRSTESGGVGSMLFRVNGGAVAPKRPPLALRAADAAWLAGEAGVAADDAAWWHDLAPNGLVVDGMPVDSGAAASARDGDWQRLEP
jgi:hypothetical protein